MRREEAGFTLLEVVVALAVIALALGGTLSIASSSATNTEYLERKVQAHWVARNAAATVRLLPGEEREPVMTHAETMLGRYFVAEIRIERTDDQLRRARITVSEDGVVLADHTAWIYDE